MDNFDIGKIFDSTLLTPDIRWNEITEFVDKSIECDVRGIAIPWYALDYVLQKVIGTDIRIVVGVDFPLGYSPLRAKLNEIDYYASMSERITDFDVVVNISAVKSANWNYVREEIATVAGCIKDHGRLCKIIIEVSRLTRDEITRVCEIMLQVPEVDYIKTGTGFGPRATTLEDVAVIRSVVGDMKKIKVSGGVKTLKQVEDFLNAGVSLFGSSSAIQIIQEFRSKRGGIS
ncbi:MAG: deoxyribose-phosphate aldolase [Pseudothermotoga sp.]